MGFGVSEYTMVFRREHGRCGASNVTMEQWAPVRPALERRQSGGPARMGAADGAVAELLVVPVYSTLALDDLAYERFLWQSGVLADALITLANLTSLDPALVETARKEILSLVMAAEVQHIVEGMSA